jgi:hypothetical protein
MLGLGLVFSLAAAFLACVGVAYLLKLHRVRV